MVRNKRPETSRTVEVSVPPLLSSAASTAPVAKTLTVRAAAAIDKPVRGWPDSFRNRRLVMCSISLVGSMAPDRDLDSDATRLVCRGVFTTGLRRLSVELVAKLSRVDRVTQSPQA